MVDPRMQSPWAARNGPIIQERICTLLEGAEGHVLELASGSGEHILHLSRALPDLTWWPSDIGARELESIAAWRESEGGENLMAPVYLDAGTRTWPLGGPGYPPAENLKAIFAVNLVHISPWEVTLGLFAGAGRHLSPQGLVILYGAFRREGRHTAPSNAEFDQRLKRENPAWGVRAIEDLHALARENGLPGLQVFPVPSNNFILAFMREATGV
jgi:hypothetical protein